MFPIFQSNMNIIDFNKRFPDEEACLEFMVEKTQLRCCQKIYKIKFRKAYACPCGEHLYPTKGTIFYNSKVPLVKWFYAVYLHAQSKHGVSSMELQRHLGITYLAAYKMNEKIRMTLKEDGRLHGEIEMDETYIGGVRRGKRGRGALGKTPLFGMVERDGRARIFVTKNVKSKTLAKIIKKSTDKSSVFYTDEFKAYSSLKKNYRHNVINHSDHLYVNGGVHTNTIEGLWSIVKRSLKGTYNNVSRRKLQQYSDQITFQYNTRLSNVHPFDLIMEKILAL